MHKCCELMLISFSWSRIYSKLGVFEGKRTPRQRTTSNELPASSLLQMKRSVSLACESHDATAPTWPALVVAPTNHRAV
jgi:hypothetical protein